MRLSELFLTQEDLANKRQDKLAALKQAIENNRAPEVHNAGGTIKGWAWEDLRELGWAEKVSEPGMGGMVDEWWEYSSAAPGPITLLTQVSGPEGASIRKDVMQPGDKTDPIQIDYS